MATADNPSAIFYNPAGIAQLEGNNCRVGLYGISLEPNYTRPSGGRSFDNQDKLHAVPQMFYTYSEESLPVAFGIGLYSPHVHDCQPCDCAEIVAHLFDWGRDYGELCQY